MPGRVRNCSENECRQGASSPPLFQIRNVIEFNNGASDTHVLGAAKDAPPLYRSPYRIAPG